jgi:hypothetical protein
MDRSGMSAPTLVVYPRLKYAEVVIDHMRQVEYDGVTLIECIVIEKRDALVHKSTPVGCGGVTAALPMVYLEIVEQNRMGRVWTLPEDRPLLGSKYRVERSLVEWQ